MLPRDVLLSWMIVLAILRCCPWIQASGLKNVSKETEVHCNETIDGNATATKGTPTIIMEAGKIMTDAMIVDQLLPVNYDRLARPITGFGEWACSKVNRGTHFSLLRTSLREFVADCLQLLVHK